MKKLFCLMLAAVIVMLTTASCGNKQLTHFEILEVGGYDSSSDANHTDDIRLDTRRIQDKKTAPNRNITCNGKEYALSYDETEISYLYNDTTDFYTSADRRVTIKINRDTGRIDLFNFYDSNYLNKVNSPEISEEECLAVAQEYLNGYIEDSTCYKLVNTAYVPLQSCKGIYTFELVRMIDNIKTSDKAYISVTVHGKIHGHVFTSLGEMRDAVLPPQETMDAIRIGLDERLDKIYSPVMEKYTVSYELDEEVFLRLADGSYALQYDYKVTLTPREGEGDPRSELTSLLVRLS